MTVQNALPSRVQALVERYRVWNAPGADGLPNTRVLLIFPAVVAVVFLVLVGLGLTGSSTGYIRTFLSTTKDSSLLVGHPEAGRSDEWYVQTSWSISQVQQGLPTVNRTFPGGMNTTVESDLPSKDWSVAFRPHLLGFRFLPLNNAMAVKWWLPGLLLIVACYVFLIGLMPRRPLSAAMVAVGFFFAPFFQWWYLPITFWPATWCLLVMASTVWLIRGRRKLPGVVLSVITGYVTVAMGMGIYVPFIVPAVIVAVGFVVGFVLTRGSNPERTALWPRLRSLLPLLVSGVAGCLVLVVWILTRLPTINLFLGTVYPGHRLVVPGSADEQSLIALIAAPMTNGFAGPAGPPLVQNASEESAFFLVGLFLLVPLAILFVRSRRAGTSRDWLTVAVIATLCVLIAYLVIPGWEPVAHLLFLDLTGTGRVRLAFGLLSIVSIAVFVSRYDEAAALSSESNAITGTRAGTVAATVSAVAVVALLLGVLVDKHSPLVFQNWKWAPVSIVLIAAVYFYARRWVTLGSLAFLIISLVATAGVNPLYVGVYDTNQTQVSRAMKALEKAQPGAWVGVGTTFLPTVLLVQSGLPGFNGFQSSPSPKMWGLIDPAHKYEFEWNRLANVSWSAGRGTPVPVNPATDQIRVNFDSCSSFAQTNVVYVLSDSRIAQKCLTLARSVREGPSTFWIYEVNRG